MSPSTRDLSRKWCDECADRHASEAAMLTRSRDAALARLAASLADVEAACDLLRRCGAADTPEAAGAAIRERAKAIRERREDAPATREGER